MSFKFQIPSIVVIQFNRRCCTGEFLELLK